MPREKTVKMSTTHPVVRAITERRLQGSTPGNRQDGFRIGLAVEGGGMRGVLSGAMLSALSDSGLADTFDAVYAYSAGAINSAYFLAGGGWHSLSVYYDDLITKDFVDYKRALSKPIVSLDFVFDVVMETKNPLDYGKLIASPIQLHLIASSVDQVKPHSFTGLGTKEDIKTALKASACIPLVAGPPVIYRGERFIDGGVLLSHPYLAAKSDECTHIMVIRTRSEHSSAGQLTVGKRLIAQRLERLQPGMKAAMIATINEYDRIATEVNRQSRSETGPPYVLDVACPEGSHNVGRFTQDRAAIYQGMRVAYGAMITAVTGKAMNILLRPASVEELP